MGTLYLVRHGQASFGADDYDNLSPLGHQQSQRLGVYFRDARKAAKLSSDLRFHDMRHEAATRLSNKLVNVLELSAMTGHRSLKSLKRYYNPTSEEMAAKLDA